MHDVTAQLVWAAIYHRHVFPAIRTSPPPPPARGDAESLRTLNRHPAFMSCHDLLCVSCRPPGAFRQKQHRLRLALQRFTALTETHRLLQMHCCQACRLRKSIVTRTTTARTPAMAHFRRVSHVLAISAGVQSRVSSRHAARDSALWARRLTACATCKPPRRQSWNRPSQTFALERSGMIHSRQTLAGLSWRRSYLCWSDRCKGSRDPLECFCRCRPCRQHVCTPAIAELL